MSGVSRGTVNPAFSSKHHLSSRETMFKLQFPIRDVTRWARKYNYRGSDVLPQLYVDSIRTRGYLTPKEQMSVARWKSQRSAGHCAKNSSSFVREVTHAALHTTDPRLKI